jgi:hypothetical protein
MEETEMADFRKLRTGDRVRSKDDGAEGVLTWVAPPDWDCADTMYVAEVEWANGCSGARPIDLELVSQR